MSEKQHIRNPIVFLYTRCFPDQIKWTEYCVDTIFLYNCDNVT